MKKIINKNSLGVGLVELLVTLLIVSVGFLSIAGLQTTAKKANFDALQRTTAVVLAKDIAERMRANPVELMRYLTPVGGVGGGSLAQPGQDCTSISPCNPGQLAEYDLWLWEQTMDGVSENREINSVSTNTGGLVSPAGCVIGPASGSAGVYTITIVWRGLNELTDLSADTCGTGTGDYGANEEFRRILSFNSFISP